MEYYLLRIFFIYSFIGWVIEVAYLASKTNKFVNRGFLNGPICPIYGISIVTMTVCLQPWKEKLLILFLGCLTIEVVLEYITAFLLEKVTHIKWWDYSDQPFNLHGRICLVFSIIWGFCGMVCLRLNEFFVDLLKHREIMAWEKIVLIVLIIVFLVDFLASILTVMSLQNKFKRVDRMARMIRLFSKKIGHWIYMNSYIRTKKKEWKRESIKVRKHYKKEHEKKLLKVLEKRMILAAPGMAPDQETLQKLERQQKKKKRRIFTRILLNRVLWTGICLLAQIFWIAVFLTKFAAISGKISLVLMLLSLGISLYIITKNENSAYKMGWIMIIMALPVFGGCLYLLFGNKNPSRKLRHQIGRVHIENQGVIEQNQEIQEKLKAEDERAATRSHYLYGQTGYPVWGNTETVYFPVGELMFHDMVQELEKAKHFIFLEYFIVEDGVFWDNIRKILERKVQEGVDVRMIYDDVGCLMLLPKNYKNELEKVGIQCMSFNSFKPILSLAMNNRDHRKIMVIDGHTAYTGGINLADEYINVTDRFGHWKDTGIKLKGDGVANFTLMFLEMWNAFRKTDSDFKKFLPDAIPQESEQIQEIDQVQELEQTEEKESTVKGYVQPFCDSPLDDEAVAENVYIDMLNQASQYVYIFTPYLIISDTMQHALCMAAKRGVDVKIVTPGVPDKKFVYRLTRSNYKELLKAGIEIYEYVPGFLHAKCCVSDDKAAVVGSINMDYRSLYLHFECGAYLYGTDSVFDVKKDVLETIKKSRKVEPIYLSQGIIEKILDALLSIVSPLV